MRDFSETEASKPECDIDSKLEAPDDILFSENAFVPTEGHVKKRSLDDCERH